MKRIGVIVAMLVICMARPAAAETVGELFNAGVDEYRQGNFDRAAEIFLDLYEKYRVESPDLLTNLGTAEFAAGKTGTAIMHLKRAGRLGAGTKAAETAEVNLDRIRSVLNERQAGKGEATYVFGAYTDAWTALFSWLHPSVAVVAFLCCWSAFFVTLSLRRRIPGSVIAPATAALAALTILSGIGAFASDRVSSYRTGVVLNDQAPLLEDVSSTQAIERLPEGLEFRILDTRGTWVRVRLSSGLSGWLPDRDAGIP